MAIQLRSSNDVKRLFSALGDCPDDLSALSVHDVDELALQGLGALNVDASGLLLSLAIATVTGWTAIRGYERNQHSMGWGLLWAGLGFMAPFPALLYSALREN